MKVMKKSIFIFRWKTNHENEDVIKEFMIRIDELIRNDAS